MQSDVISSIRARRVWDSRGRPTVEAEVFLEGGAHGRAIAPAGASTGSGEALDKRDGGEQFGGMDVRHALKAIHEVIAPKLIGMSATEQETVDRRLIALDNTPNKADLGGNSTIAVSLAVLHAAAAAHGQPLWRYLSRGRAVRTPLPEIQIFGGGAHANGRVDVQDFMVMCPGASSFSEALEWTAEIYRAAGSLMKSAGKLQGVADEGGFWPAFSSNEEALETLVKAISSAGFKPGEGVGISLDVAATELRRAAIAKGDAVDSYRLGLTGQLLNSGQMIDMLGRWMEDYPIFSIEDPLAEDDFVGFSEFTRRYGARCQIIGDDLLVTREDRVQLAHSHSAINAALIKPNQAGTVWETQMAFAAARNVGWATIVSARSGESEDVSIAHLAVGWDAGQLKVGSFSRSERMAKWNEVLRIEEALGTSAHFAGWDVLPKALRPRPEHRGLEAAQGNSH